ncbi:MAG TPA: type IV secretory system conjugative DNA transfer family protein [Chloroflexota bacterium]|nr:type IV secretory system conjugative DNA transfer family protein [Chloroflexota bacterium]
MNRINLTLFRLGCMAALAVTFLYTAHSTLADLGAGDFEPPSPLLLGWVLILALTTYVSFVHLTPGDSRPTTHGSARWATARDIGRLLRGKNAPLEPGSIALAPFGWFRKVVLPHFLAQMHVLLLAPSGSGKTRGTIMTNICQAVLHSLVATDPKNELWQNVSGYHPRPLRYAPLDPDHSEPFNWIPLCQDERLAQLLAAAVMQPEENGREEPFWKYLELQLCSGIFSHAAYLDTPTPLAAYQLLRLGADDILEPLHSSPSEQARTIGKLLSDLKVETRGGVLAGVANRLTFLQLPGVRRFTSANFESPDFTELLDRPTALFWSVHEQDTAQLKPLSSLFFTLMLDQLGRQTGPVPVTLFLGEFASLGRIPDFPTTISVARGRGLSLVLGLQSIRQLDTLYGRDAADVIQEQCATKIVLHGLYGESAESISRALGETTVSQEFPTHHPDGMFVSHTTFSEQHVKRALLTADEVRRIGDNETLLIVSNYRPIRAGRWWWKGDPKPAATRSLGQAHQATPSDRQHPRLRMLTDDLNRLDKEAS